MATNVPMAPTVRVLVWDVPVRVFHWLLVAAFAGVFLTAESERLRLTHVQLGYTMVGLVLFRSIWGLVGSPYARFASFVTGPSAVWRYLRSVPTATPEHHVGHNPAGAAAMVGLMALTLVAGVTGWLGYEGLAGDWILEVHEAAAGAMMALVGLHVAGVMLASLRHRENLIGAMVTGWKRGPMPTAQVRRHRLVGVVLMVAVGGYWALWGGMPASTDSALGRLGQLVPRLADQAPRTEVTGMVVAER